MLRKLLPILLVLFASSIEAQTLYKEFYRPQIHLSPEFGWMGDPNGMIYFNGKYHLLWWGHAKSDDLVHWVQYNNFAMQGSPSGFGYWSGSVVVDSKNTAGFNSITDTAMVAVYTMHYDNGVEKVGISYSLNHTSFQYYIGNPVININQYDFRDPQVFWHEPTNKWVMVIARAIDRAVDFYASSDLKTWIFLSSFKDRGGKDQVWEVPDLVQLPVNDDMNSKKWVLICGMGPNKEQYWIGDFDGTTFTLDPEDNLLTGKNVDGELFAGFDGNTFENWQVTGTAFGSGPATGTLPDQQAVNGFIGKSFINSYHGGDATTGKLVSPDFTITKKFINFLIGGGMGAGLKMSLFVDGSEVLYSYSLQNQEYLRWVGWNVTQWMGKTAHIEIVDNNTGGWGHILVDHIVFSDEFYDTRIENGNWVDWGKDFYACRTYRNYSTPKVPDRTLWIAWMGNWTYANSIPTTPWKGAEALPRSIKLVKNERGYQILQYPIDEFQTLRADNISLGETTISGTYNLDNFKPKWNVYELKVSFKITSKDQVFGLNLADNGVDKKLIIGYNANTSRLYIDRTKAGLTNFNSYFPTVMYAPTPFPKDSIMDLHIFMDQSSIEVFANKNQTAMTALVFTKPSETGISLFSTNGSIKLLALEAWNLNSIWGIVPSDLPSSIKSNNFESDVVIFPNPINNIQELTFSSNEQIHINDGILQITDLTGKIVYNKSIKNNLLSEVRIDDKSNSISKGIYLIRVQSIPINFVKKLIVN